MSSKRKAKSKKKEKRKKPVKCKALMEGNAFGLGIKEVGLSKADMMWEVWSKMKEQNKEKEDRRAHT